MMSHGFAQRRSVSTQPKHIFDMHFLLVCNWGCMLSAWPILPALLAHQGVSLAALNISNVRCTHLLSTLHVAIGFSTGSVSYYC